MILRTIYGHPHLFAPLTSFSHGNICLGSLVNVKKGVHYFILLVLRLHYRIVEPCPALPCSHNGPKQKTETFSWPGLETAPVGPKKNPIMFISIRIDQPKQVQTGHATWLTTWTPPPKKRRSLRAWTTKL